jgi:antitoxin component of RelBE/YafQ-DinJ toxin-antitoxin module
MGATKVEQVNKSTKDKTLQVRVDADTYTSIAVHLMDNGLTLSDYIRGLIESDLKK